jgi:hypothetical protein
MKYISRLLFFILVLSQNEDQKRFAENRKEVQKKKSFNKHTKGWIFYDTPVTEASENSLSSWNEWHFLAELAQNPKKRLPLKAKTKKKKVWRKPKFLFNDKPQIRSRIEL